MHPCMMFWHDLRPTVVVHMPKIWDMLKLIYVLLMSAGDVTDVFHHLILSCLNRQ